MKVKERMQGMIVGVLVGVLCTGGVAGGVAFAKSAVENINVTYSNIKVYKDNVLCELKDANGTTIEPFIYKGTTYMPVRGTASLADMEVTWDGANKSVYLWDNMVPSGTYLLEVCPPYETSRWVNQYYSSEGNSFEMAGKKYSNGFTIETVGGYALFNLDSKYSTLECTVGHASDNENAKSVSFIVDGRTVKEVELEAEDLPKTVSIPVNYGLQLKIVKSSEGGTVGLGNMTVS
jgi:hypothetical protein